MSGPLKTFEIRFPRDPVTVLKETVEFPLDHPSKQPVPDDSQRRRIFDAVFQVAGIRAIRFEQVRVHPPAERSTNLNVSELPVLNIPAMLRRPMD